MMRLFLVRHADASFTSSDDYNRPLSELGKKQAQLSAAYIQQNTQSERSLIVASSALRTCQTAQIISDHQPSADLYQDRAFYEARVGQWCDVIIEKSDASNLILVGHNPTMGFLAKHLNTSQQVAFSPACVAQYHLEIAADGLKLPAQYIDFYIPHAN
ncbi:histidine phosphatase family protein [Marinicella sp. S1101]|uniref:SixA phosphatase family protein n=1 Tax=Marinicella marina TaxID=2996016 RepID=UPI002260D86F|nr:histidine phosphatase family protein [Marinicella marina]MCX7552865.1 histidine phosphatase family protein [Marinicella marina]MDJ1139826.1 histidine phosphatase family protein [Marinicella marina]